MKLPPVCTSAEAPDGVSPKVTLGFVVSTAHQARCNFSRICPLLCRTLIRELRKARATPQPSSAGALAFSGVLSGCGAEAGTQK